LAEEFIRLPRGGEDFAVVIGGEEAKHLREALDEPLRLWRRLRTLRRWSHDEEDLEPLFA
jgi:hypothetical protein